MSIRAYAFAGLVLIGVCLFVVAPRGRAVQAADHTRATLEREVANGEITRVSSGSQTAQDLRSERAFPDRLMQQMTAVTAPDRPILPKAIVPRVEAAERQTVTSHASRSQALSERTSVVH